MKKFYHNKKILITGHTGFKGTWLSQILTYWGAKVRGYSLQPNTNPSIFNALQIKNQIQKSIIGDIRDFKKFTNIVSDFNPDIIFHMAAQPLVRDSYDDPRYTYDVNVMGTVNVLEAIRLNNIKAGIIITTDKVYKNKEHKIAHKETDELGGYDPYSTSKACDELVVSSYVDSFFNPSEYKKSHNTLVASVRAGNVIGGGDWSKDRLIPDLIKCIFEKGQGLELRNPNAVRPWQHVLEPLFGYLLLGQLLYKNDVSKIGAWNFGPLKNSAITVRELIEKCFSFLQKNNHKINLKADKVKHESEYLSLNINKAKNKLHWKPIWGIDQTTEETLSWYETFYQHPDKILNLTLTQIDQYYEEYRKRN